jgi:uncharacterized protein YjbI with pentapeptide repeats
MQDPDDDRRCRYVFDPTEVPGATRGELERVLDDEGRWRCPHAPQGDRELCPFHLAPVETPEGAVERRFLEAIDRLGERPKQFIGARVAEFDFERSIIECADNNPVDMRYATFEGTTTLEYSIVRQPLNLDGATFEGHANFTETRFQNEVYLNGATFEREVRCFGTRFVEGVWCYEAAFDEANLHRSRFGGPADFTDAWFGECHLREAVFTARADFDDATFEHASLPGVKFHDDVSFEGVRLPESVTLRHAEFDAIASFDAPVPIDESVHVDMRDAIVERGRLVPASADVVFDLQAATLGDVSITEETPRGDLLDRFRFVNTTFEGFDFGAYREALNATEWEIHHTKPVPGVDAELPPAGVLESTYLKAKNGANDVGDTKAAAEFFRKEMTYRRHQHVPSIRRGPMADRAVALWRWTASALLDATSGYGERPSRVIVCAVLVVFGFGGLFSVMTSAQPYGTPLGYLILSLESFITLVLGGAALIEDPRVRLLAEVEGFIGAFLIALFVFTLTRSIHR